MVRQAGPGEMAELKVRLGCLSCPDTLGLDEGNQPALLLGLNSPQKTQAAKVSSFSRPSLNQ